MNNKSITMPAEVRRYLQTHHVLTLATHGPEGLWAAAVFYAGRDWNLYFLSAGHTRHARNIAANPQVAGTIQEDNQEWAVIQGIQLAGEVVLLQGTAREEAIFLYQQKYPFIAADTDGTLRKALNTVNWYGLQLSRLYFIDNSKGFGHRDEILRPE